MHLLIFFCAALLAVCAERVSYDGYKVYRLNLQNEKQFFFLAKFKDNPSIDFWSQLRFNGEPIDVMVHPNAQIMFRWMLNSHKIQHQILINNVETVLQREKLLQMKAPMPPQGKITFTKYHRFSQINSYLDELLQYYPNKVTVKSIGTSYEKRNMKIIQISTNPTANKPVIFIDAGMHAKEWIAPAVALYAINQLVENSTYSHLLDRVDWHILPVVNPDGYEFSHERDRFWRKTRSIEDYCIGVDVNRNFGFHWNEGGSSSDPCADTYMGRYPFSAVEGKNVKEYIEGYKQRVKLYLTFHSFGNFLLYPWAYTYELPYDHVELQSVAENVNAAMVEAGGEKYTIGSSTNVLYPASGASTDWCKGSAGIDLSYTMELPGGGQLGFDLPPSKIAPTVKQTFAGIEVFGNYIDQKFGEK